MNFARSGIILLTHRFDTCVDFYRGLFGLDVMFEDRRGEFRLCCLDMGDAYLLIETDGGEQAAGKCPHILRFNVDDIEQALADVKTYGIDAAIESHDWGDTINILDPDGNQISIRDEAGFKLQANLPNKFT